MNEKYFFAVDNEILSSFHVLISCKNRMNGQVTSRKLQSNQFFLRVSISIKKCNKREFA